MEVLLFLKLLQILAVIVVVFGVGSIIALMTAEATRSHYLAHKHSRNVSICAFVSSALSIYAMANGALVSLHGLLAAVTVYMGGSYALRAYRHKQKISES